MWRGARFLTSSLTNTNCVSVKLQLETFASWRQQEAAKPNRSSGDALNFIIEQTERDAFWS